MFWIERGLAIFGLCSLVVTVAVYAAGLWVSQDDKTPHARRYD